MSKGWYQRTNNFTPYTKADGQAVSDEFDAVQASFERIPEMRDDGRGFKVSPIIPRPTAPDHPVTLSMLTESEKSIDTAKKLILQKASQVETNATETEKNTATAEQAKKTAVASAATATQKAQSASASEVLAKKWAAHPLDQIVQENNYSALHYATKAKGSEQAAKTSATEAIIAKNTATTAAATATAKASEASIHAETARRAAFRENRWIDLTGIPNASTSTKGITQHYSGYDSDSEAMSFTAKGAKALKTLIDAVVKNLANYIPNSKKSNAVDSTSSDTVATSLAAKTAYDKAVAAEKLASGKYTAQNATTTQRGLTQHYSGYDSDREDLSATAKVIKLLKGFVDSNTRRFDNYILNSKKSSAIDSNSADTVATSAAVKAAYDLAAGAVPKSSAVTQFISVGNYRFALQHDGQIFIYDSANGNAIKWGTNRNALKSDFSMSYYPNHYGGATVYKNKVNQQKITIIHKLLNKDGYDSGNDFFLITLPEAYSGFVLAFANAFARYSGTGTVYALPTVAEVIDNGTKVKVYCSADAYGAALNILVIGT